MMMLGSTCNNSEHLHSATPAEVKSERSSPLNELATLRDGICDVAIEALLFADVLRGYPPSRKREDALTRDPELARNYEQESIGNRYLACTYLVRVGATHYRYLYTSHNGPGSASLVPALCARTAEATAAATLIRDATDGCRDFSRAASHNVILEPLNWDSSR